MDAVLIQRFKQAVKSFNAACGTNVPSYHQANMRLEYYTVASEVVAYINTLTIPKNWGVLQMMPIENFPNRMAQWRGEFSCCGVFNGDNSYFFDDGDIPCAEEGYAWSVPGLEPSWYVSPDRALLAMVQYLEQYPVEKPQIVLSDRAQKICVALKAKPDLLNEVLIGLRS